MATLTNQPKERPMRARRLSRETRRKFREGESKAPEAQVEDAKKAQAKKAAKKATSDG
jgi:hypothetical protein